jgi:dynein heavy chain
LASLKSLNKNDVTEVKAMKNPPDGVKMVLEAVCIMKKIPPKKVAGDKPGTKIDDYTEPARGLLTDPGKFLESLFTYDKENIPDSVVQKIEPYINNEKFTPAAIAQVSKACTSICLWVRAMYKFYFVNKTVAPKREAQRVALEELSDTQRALANAKAKLKEVEEKLATLQAKYDDSVRKKADLEVKVKECEEKVIRAGKLVSGLGDEKIRWAENVKQLDASINNVIGDILIASGFIAYLGPFIGSYREHMTHKWVQHLKKYQVPHTDNTEVVKTLGDAVKIRNWQLAGLPKDSLSVQNGIIVQYSQRWPLFIDPQGQANRWVKSLEKDNGIDVIKLSDRDFLRSLENAIRFGKPCLLENIGTELDPALEPVLLRQTFKQQGSLVIKLGDAIIPYHEDFKFYITTKLPNPHYTPEVSVKVTLINFTLSPSGLEDQMLGCVVAEERPDLEEAKNQLIITNSIMKNELKELEDTILLRLSKSENPVDDIELINALEASKIKSTEIKAKVVVSEQTERDIDATRSEYVPVAINTQILFFCVSDLANIDPMYQYSLEWFTNIFLNSIQQASKADNLKERINHINEHFTYNLYSNVCRSLFEKHKLLFAFLLTVRIMMNKEKISMDEYRFFLAGGTLRPKQIQNPANEWISERAWLELLTLESLQSFNTFTEDFKNHLSEYKKIFDSVEPHHEQLPEPWNSKLDSFQKIIGILKISFIYFNIRLRKIYIGV